MRPILSTLFWIFLTVSSILLFPVAVVIWALTAPFDRRRRLLHLFTCFWASLYTWLNPAWPVRIEGRHHVRRNEAYVMVANHLSLLDILVLFRLFTHYKWVSKIENFRVPCIGWNMSLNRYIKLRRGDRASVVKMMKACRETLDEGNSIMMFPEGTRSPTGRMRAFKTGAFELAVRDFLNEQFQAHDRLFTFHDDRDHYHAHVVIGLQGADGRWLNPRKNDLLAWRESFAASLERHGIAAEATPAYSRGKGKDGYRRDLEELSRRGTRERPSPSPSYEAETEERAIRRRAEAWSRIADHYAGAGDQEAADAIRDYVADHYDYRPEPGAAQEQAQAPTPEPPARRRKRPRDEDRER